MGLKEDLKSLFDQLNRASLRPDRLIMNQADFDDVVRWQEGRCTTKGHPGYGRSVSECAHPECVVRSVLEC